MSWIPNRAAQTRTLLVGVLAIGSVCGALLTMAAHAATIVVRSNGPSASAFPVGKSLPSGAAIVLKAGDVVTVLDAGGTRVLRGPGKVSVSGAGQATVNGIAVLIADTGARQSRTGATRGSNAAAPHPTNIWYVDVARGGNFCVGNVKALALWRAQSDRATSVTVEPTEGARVVIEFRPGQALVAWPLGALSVSDGSRFRISEVAPGHADPVSVTITARLLPSSPNSLDAVAQALLERGCATQVDTLVAATTVDAGN